MKTIEINIQDPYKCQLINGRKTIEGRLFKGKYMSIEVGDIVKLKSSRKKFKVVKTRIASSFRDLLIMCGVENLVPSADSLEEAEAIYKRIYHDKKEEDMVIGLYLELIKN